MGKRRGSHGAGKLAFPGGHIEPGETTEQTAERELFEETGIRASIFSRIGWTDDRFEEGMHYVTLFVECTPPDPKPALLEPGRCDGWEWVPKRPDDEDLFLPVRNLLKSCRVW